MTWGDRHCEARSAAAIRVVAWIASPVARNDVVVWIASLSARNGEGTTRSDKVWGHAVMSVYRSRQSGFMASINWIFLFRFPALICFSRVMALSIVG